MPAPDEYDPLPGSSFSGEEKILATYWLPDQLKLRTTAAVRYAWEVEALSDLETQTGLIRAAIDQYVGEMEREFNAGRPFPRPEVVPRRRGPKRTGQWIKFGVYFPESLLSRLVAAAEFSRINGVRPAVSNANQLVVEALERYLTQLEDDQNRGKPFRGARRTLPAGRRPARR